jgi:hypothetical protein
MEQKTDKIKDSRDSNIHEPDHHQPDGQPLLSRTFGRIDQEHPIGGEMSDILRGLFSNIYACPG